jgi:hypothetical protein
MRDSWGRLSLHVTLAVPALIVASLWFLVGGISIQLPGGFAITTATKSGSDYLLFVGPWLSALGWRDYLKCRPSENMNGNPNPEPTV